MKDEELLKPSNIEEERVYLYYSHKPIEVLDMYNENNYKFIGYVNYFEYLDFRCKVKEKFREETKQGLGGKFSGYFFYYKDEFIPISYNGKLRSNIPRGFFSLDVDLLSKLF